MARVQKITTNPSFIDGRWVAKGFPVWVDTDKLSGRERNFADVGTLAGSPAVVEMAAVAPTGPNPKQPQQVPPDAKQTVEGHVIPGAVLVGETVDVLQAAETQMKARQTAAALLEDEVEDDLDTTKAGLIEIAEREGVEIDAADTKAEICAAIEAKRASA